MTQKTYRVNLTLKNEVAKKFMSTLTKQRRLEIETKQLNLTSASEYARSLIEQALRKTEVKGVQFLEKNINYREKRNRFSVTFYPSDLIKINDAYPNTIIKKGTKINVTISL